MASLEAGAEPLGIASAFRARGRRGPMRIAIHGVDGLRSEVRAYIEYRMFSAIRPFVRDCERLNIHVTGDNLTGSETPHTCSATLDLGPAGRVRVRATGNRLYAAVDTAAERLGRHVERRLAAAAGH